MRRRRTEVNVELRKVSVQVFCDAMHPNYSWCKKYNAASKRYYVSIQRQIMWFKWIIFMYAVVYV
jgi:hypothetical protein